MLIFNESILDSYIINKKKTHLHYDNVIVYIKAIN